MTRLFSFVLLVSSFTAPVTSAQNVPGDESTSTVAATKTTSDSQEVRDIVFASDREGTDNEIWRMRPDGSNPRRLTNNEGVNDNFPVWSPDGSQIAFLSNRDTSSQGFQIFVMDADGSHVRAVGPRKWPLMLWPEWSPDGSEILFSAGGGLLKLLDEIERL